MQIFLRNRLTELVAHIPGTIHRWCYVHLTVSMFSFIILVCWGIPFSLLGFLGNAIFNPVLALFLGLSSLLFFTELLYIPNTYIAYALDMLSRAWLYALTLHTNLNVEIPCAQPSVLTLATLICGTAVIMLLRITYFRKNILLVALLCCGLLVSQREVATYCTDELPCGKETMHIIKHNEQLIVIDPGCLGRSLSAISYAQHTLIPHIIQHYGTHTIDHLIILKPGKLCFDAVLALLQRTVIKHIYIPLWEGSLSKSGLFTFMHLKEQAALQETRIHRLSQQELLLVHDHNGSLLLKPLHKVICRGPIKFNAFCICHTIDKQSVTFYPSDYRS
jgi:hypothetical protein